MLYVIKLGFEMLNIIFFDMFDENALINWWMIRGETKLQVLISQKQARLRGCLVVYFKKDKT